MPGAHLLPDRLDAVLAVIYLIFNEGYSGRVDLAAEAISLGRVLATLMPDQPVLFCAERAVAYAARDWCSAPVADRGASR